MNYSYPRARRENLIVQNLDHEVLLYDTVQDRAHVLNETAAAVWRFADGRHSVEQIAQLVAREANGAANADLVWLALSQLAKASLLETQAFAMPPTANFTRREFLQKAALAAVILPVVKTISAPTSQQSASCSTTTCTTDNDCCGGLLCFSGTCSCFVAGTLVWYGDGTLRPIEMAQVGDMVLARDEVSGVVAPQRVDKTYIHHNRMAFTLNFGTSALTTTATHPFYTDTGWVKAIDLRAGMDCYLEDGARVTLEQVEHPLDYPQTVYNLQVAGYHTYFVGKQGVWVHNRTTVEDIPTS